MKVADGALEKKPSDPSQYRISEIAVEERHGPEKNRTAKPVAHYQIISLAQLANELAELREVIAIVRINHNDELAACCGDSPMQGCSVATLPDRDNAAASAPSQAATEEFLEVSVVTPCLNESATIGTCVKKAQQTLQEHVGWTSWSNSYLVKNLTIAHVDDITRHANSEGLDRKSRVGRKRSYW